MNISFWLFCIYINAQIMIAKSLYSLTDRLACVGEKFCAEDSEYLNFILVGDIGGLPIYPYKSYAQVKVAKAMAILAQNKNISFIINLGDNIYFNGVQNVFDARFKLSFEDVYNDPNLLMPWYTIAGNHDHLGNVSAQIAYTNYSDRWTFPNYYYKISYKIGPKNKTSIDILMIDTVVLCGNPIEIHGSGVFDWVFAKHKTPSEPDDVEAANQQLHWLENQLENSHADYLFVAGHYPIYSASGHGSLKCLIEKLDHLLRKYGVNAYFSGHDHDLQHIQVTGSNTNRTSLDYIVVGAGSRSDHSLKHRKSLPENSLLFNYPTGWNPFSQLGFSYGAFVSVEVRRERAEFTFYSGTLEEKYQMFILPRKLNKM